MARSAQSRRRVGALCLVLLVVGFTGAALGADKSGNIVGTVTDASGAAIVGAQVVIHNQETNATRETLTSTLGDFSCPLLPSGVYEVTVSAQGFRRTVRRGVRVDVNGSARIDVSLEVGGRNEEIVVSTATPVLEKDSSALGQVIGSRQIQALPLNERNFLSFALLAAGVQMSADGSQLAAQGGAVSVSGAREQSNDFLLEGFDNNDAMINQFSVLPSVDAIQEFKVQSSNSSAEFGRSGGAQVNVVLKSGTDEVHGTAFEFARNRHLDARNFFDRPDCVPGAVPGTCGDIPALDRSQFGGTIGGPLRRDRTFVFLSYEGLVLRQADTREATVPSQVLRNALAGLPGPLNPAGQAAYDLLPPANVGQDLQNSTTFVSAPTIRDNAHFASVKLDHLVGGEDAISATYSLYDDERFNPFDPLLAFTNLPGYGSTWSNRGQVAGAAWTHSHGRTTNDLRFGFQRRSRVILQQNVGIDQNQALGFPDVLTRPVDLGFPDVVLPGFDGIGEPRNLPQASHDNTFQWADNLAFNPGWNGGRHHLRIGGEVRRLQLNSFLDALARGEWFFEGVFTGNPLSDLLLGLPTFALGVQGNTFTALRSTAVNLYFQDDVRVARRFTLNLGLRWEYNGPPADTQDRLSSPDLSPASLTCTPRPDCQFVRAGTGGVPRGLYSGNYNGFGPRLGFAWQPFEGGRMVVRAGYGIFYDAGLLNGNFLPRLNPPSYETGVFLNFGASTIQTIFSQPPVPAAPIAVYFDPAFRDPYLQHWNADVQYEVLRNTLLDVAYVGSKGTGLLSQRNLNQLTGGVAPYPQFGPIDLISSGASSGYHALQVKAERRVSGGLSLLAAYTWSKSIDDGSALFGTATEPGFPQDSFDLRSERGLSNFNAAHRFVLSYVYSVEPGSRLASKGPLGTMLRNTQTSAILVLQTGHPFTVNRGIDQSHSGTAQLGYFTDRPDQVADPLQAGPVAANPDPKCQKTISNGGSAADQVHTVQTWFNPCAFVNPASGFGNAGRNALIGPAYEELDLSFSRSVPLHGERLSLQLRADVFNAFNHPNFDVPDRISDSPTFGQLRSSNLNGNKPPRQIQMGVRLLF